ncbi:hypothetical protein niasHT_036177 [Heterodera trifolii]|uniref:Fucosyltransferase n=1 Tax=Heterodera trifolii TaxID=157864 RepID=A0ABD2IG09_9BILA
MVLLCVWWCSSGLVRYELVPAGQTINNCSANSSSSIYRGAYSFSMTTHAHMLRSQRYKKLSNFDGRESSASAVLFHVRQSFKPLPKNRRPEQLYAMMSIESPYWCYEKMEYVPDDYFNVSITYHSASTIPVPYGQLTQITALTSPEEIWSAAEISERMSRKKRFALQIVSHCGAPSGRDLLTKQLHELIELDLFGKCSGKNCDEQKCYQQQMESHFFYLAFENTVCSEYVTEKFWNALRSLTVPVVLCREVVRESGIPDDLYIAADDFDNATALADHLKALHKDKDRYLGSVFNEQKGISIGQNSSEAMGANCEDFRLLSAV